MRVERGGEWAFYVIYYWNFCIRMDAFVQSKWVNTNAMETVRPIGGRDTSTEVMRIFGLGWNATNTVSSVHHTTNRRIYIVEYTSMTFEKVLCTYEKLPTFTHKHTALCTRTLTAQLLGIVETVWKSVWKNGERGTEKLILHCSQLKFRNFNLNSWILYQF